jgi:hypothetical protein
MLTVESQDDMIEGNQELCPDRFQVVWDRSNASWKFPVDNLTSSKVDDLLLHIRVACMEFFTIAFDRASTSLDTFYGVFLLSRNTVTINSVFSHDSIPRVILSY